MANLVCFQSLARLVCFVYPKFMGTTFQYRSSKALNLAVRFGRFRMEQYLGCQAAKKQRIQPCILFRVRSGCLQNISHNNNIIQI